MTKYSIALLVLSTALTGCYGSHEVPVELAPCEAAAMVVDLCEGMPATDPHVVSRMVEQTCGEEGALFAEEHGCTAEHDAWAACWIEQMLATCDVSLAYEICEQDLRLHSALNACSSPTGAVQEF